MTPASADIQRLMLRLCHHAEADLVLMSRAPSQAAHSLRVRMKKLRALLALFRHIISSALFNRLRRRIHTIKDTLASDRDLEVLQKLAHSFHQHPRLARLNLPKETHGPTSTKVQASIRRHLSRLRQELAALPAEKLTQKEILSAYIRCQHHCHRRWKTCVDTEASPALMHRWRKRIKVWYYLSLALATLPRALENVRPARRLGHLLGKVHDLDLLSTRVSGPASAQWHKAIAQKRRRTKSRIFALAVEALHIRKRKLRKALQHDARQGA